MKKDILEIIQANFKDPERVINLLDVISVRQEKDRIIRSILILSDGDYDSVREWVKKANSDYRNIIFYAEYDNRNVRKYNFSYPVDEQLPYSYKE